MEENEGGHSALQPRVEVDSVDIEIHQDGSVSLYVEVPPAGWVQVFLVEEDVRTLVFDWLRDHR